MRILSIDEVTQLLRWIEENKDVNWGLWKDYPLHGCSYTSIEDCHFFIKFDTKVKFQDETFTHVISSRRYSKNGRISVSKLKSLAGFSAS